MVVMSVRIIYECENYLIVNKPFDMYINSDDENEKNTVTSHIASPDSHLSTSAHPLHFVHRLDYATSGVLCIAKNKGAAARAGRLFERRAARKYYLAVVRGHVDFELADIQYSIGADPSAEHSCHRMLAVTDSCGGSSAARAAHTRLLVLETGYYDKEPVSVVLLKPITGRRHQLRVHCQSVGHTVLGDYTYSGARDSAPHRMYLHAARLVLPWEGEPLDVLSAEPFFTDARFTAKWMPAAAGERKYRTADEFRAACDVIDRPHHLGFKYVAFKTTD